MTRLQIRKKLHKAVLGKSFTGYYVREKLLRASLLATKKIATKTTVKAFGLQTASLSIATLTVFGVATFQATSYAAIVGFTDRANFNANDSVNWANLGLSGTYVSNPFSIYSDNGNKVDVKKLSGTSFQRLDQGNGFNGNFSLGDSLLSTAGPGGPIDIYFTNPVARVGTQFHTNSTFNTFLRPYITAYDNQGKVLGFYKGYSSNSEGSAIFIGIGTDDDTNQISRVDYSVPFATEPQNFIINNLSLRTTESVPEPLTILGTLAAGSIGVALRCKAKKQEC